MPKTVTKSVEVNSSFTLTRDVKSTSNQETNDNPKKFLDDAEIYYGTVANDSVSLGDGNDYAYTYGGDDLVFSGEGSDFVSTGDGDDRVVELRSFVKPEQNYDIDRFYTGNGEDRVILTDGGRNYVDSGSGDDDVSIRNGFNTVYLGDGADQFGAGDGYYIVDMGQDDDADVFRFNQYDDIRAEITNFDVENDALSLFGFGLQTFKEHAQQFGDDVVYEHEEARIVLNNVDLDMMSDANIL